MINWLIIEDDLGKADTLFNDLIDISVDQKHIHSIITKQPASTKVLKEYPECRSKFNITEIDNIDNLKNKIESTLDWNSGKKWIVMLDVQLGKMTDIANPTNLFYMISGIFTDKVLKTDYYIASCSSAAGSTVLKNNYNILGISYKDLLSWDMNEQIHVRQKQLRKIHTVFGDDFDILLDELNSIECHYTTNEQCNTFYQWIREFLGYNSMDQFTLDWDIDIRNNEETWFNNSIKGITQDANSINLGVILMLILRAVKKTDQINDVIDNLKKIILELQDPRTIYIIETNSNEETINQIKLIYEMLQLLLVNKSNSTTHNINSIELTQNSLIVKLRNFSEGNTKLIKNIKNKSDITNTSSKFSTPKDNHQSSVSVLKTIINTITDRNTIGSPVRVLSPDRIQVILEFKFKL